MTLHDVDVYKCIHASECSFLVAVVYETPDCSMARIFYIFQAVNVLLRVSKYPPNAIFRNANNKLL